MCVINDSTFVSINPFVNSPGVSRMVATQVISTQVSERNMGSSNAIQKYPVTMEFQFDAVS